SRDLRRDGRLGFRLQREIEARHDAVSSTAARADVELLAKRGQHVIHEGRGFDGRGRREDLRRRGDGGRGFRGTDVTLSHHGGEHLYLPLTGRLRVLDRVERARRPGNAGEQGRLA